MKVAGNSTEPSTGYRSYVKESTIDSSYSEAFCYLDCKFSRNSCCAIYQDRVALLNFCNPPKWEQ